MQDTSAHGKLFILPTQILPKEKKHGTIRQADRHSIYGVLDVNNPAAQPYVDNFTTYIAPGLSGGSERLTVPAGKRLVGD